MTGRRLYDIYTDAAKGEYVYGDSRTATASNNDRPVAWPFLAVRDRNVWNVMARHITLKPRKRVA